MEKIKILHKTNQFKALLALTKASLTATFRNPSALFFSFAFPFIFISIFGLLGNSSKRFTIAVYSGSVQSGPVYNALKKIDTIKLETNLTDKKIEENLRKGKLAVAIKITESQLKIPNTERSMPHYTIDMKKSAASPQDSEVIDTIISRLGDNFNLPKKDISSRLVKINKKTIEGRKFEQIDFILPGQLSFALLSSALFGVSLTIITLKKELVIKRIFAAPINKFNIIFSESLAKVVIALLQSVVIILAGHLMFNFTLIYGLTTFINMLILSLLGIFTFLAFGLFVSTIGKDQESVSPIANLIMMPQFLLSGAFFPIDSFPSFLQPISKILPMTFLNDAFRKVAFEGASLGQTLPEMLGLAIWAIVMYLLVARMFKWD